ncbi:hypothetical protein IU450_13620 [Nocardia abscessus]|nr:hypothetical protein [Nocardia abscessus]MBF6336918.1 hypothetical protein [Nocardia abscessus]
MVTAVGIYGLDQSGGRDRFACVSKPHTVIAVDPPIRIRHDCGQLTDLAL